MRKVWLAMLVLLTCGSACSTEKSPGTPDAGGLNLSGTWKGPIEVEAEEARMSWELTQVNGTVTGPVTVVLPNGIVLLNGSLTGSVAGMTLPYTITVSNGGVPSRPTCIGQLSGTMNVTVANPPSLSGPMGVSSSNCTPPFDATAITLTRQ
jgi:hypothetical protein